jgi:hypothetical protein
MQLKQQDFWYDISKVLLTGWLLFCALVLAALVIFPMFVPEHNDTYTWMLVAVVVAGWLLYSLHSIQNRLTAIERRLDEIGRAVSVGQ